MRRATIILGLALAWASAGSARGDTLLSVGVGNLQLPPSGSGYVDVTLSGAADPVQIAGFEFRITTAGATRLEFANPQPTAYLADANYVFHGDSFDATLSPPTVGGVSRTVVPGDTFIGSDSTASLGAVEISGSRLLTRLFLTAATGLPPAAGDQFTISLEPGGNTGFLDSQSHAIAYTSTPGIVTVQTVPEPGTCGLLLIGGCLAILFRRFHGQRARGRRFADQ